MISLSKLIQDENKQYINVYLAIFVFMNTLRIDIINPKAARILKDLADLNLISIQDTSKNGFAEVLKKLRAKSKSAQSLEEITSEVEKVRSKCYSEVIKII